MSPARHQPLIAAANPSETLAANGARQTGQKPRKKTQHPKLAQKN
jgi:hypothetical protein